MIEYRRTLGLFPRTQLDQYQIIPNTQEIDLTTDRTNCTMREGNRCRDMIWGRHRSQVP